MKNKYIKPSFLQTLYLFTSFVLFSLIVLTPKLIRGTLYLTEKLILKEELVEGVLLGMLIFIGILITNLYKHEVSKQKELINKITREKKTTEEKLIDSFKYIGTINIQIQEIKSIFSKTNRYPETKTDFKKVFRFYSERILGIANAQWILLRIINSPTLKTVSEHFETRADLSFEYPHISNKMIVEDSPVPSYTTVVSNPENLNILVGCVLPLDNISKDERIFIQAITNELTMLFVIFNSHYYTKAIKVLEN